MAITINGSGGVTGLTALPDSAMSSGSIIQIVQTQITATSSTTSQSFGDTSLVRTITPTSASNKIFCSVKLQHGGSHPSSVIFKLVRVSSSGTSENIAYSTGSTNQPGFHQNYMNETGAGMGIYGLITVGVDSLDTAIDANEHTYKVQWRRHQGTVYLNRTGYGTTATDYSGTGCSTITLMEVAA